MGRCGGLFHYIVAARRPNVCGLLHSKEPSRPSCVVFVSAEDAQNALRAEIL